uniref:Hydrophobic seed protein domain-containing protein n=1 Tax=Chenopodium quinoa TaxID=63459 RepID=A0A803NAR8_CHEQI
MAAKNTNSSVAFFLALSLVLLNNLAFGNLINLDAAACLCTVLHANVLGLVDADLNVALKALVNYCDRELPKGFQCPPRRRA